MAGLSKQPDLVLEQIKANHAGGVANLNGTRFEWGKVSRLVQGRSLSADSPAAQTVLRRLRVEPDYIGHIDHLSKERKLQLESEFNLPAGSISGSLSSSKVDVFIRCKSGTPYFISFKDLSGASKLGQVSARTTYGKAVLDGGLESVSIPDSRFPASISWTDTGLSRDQFNKIPLRHQRLAYFKRHYETEWRSMVEAGLSEAKRQILEFCSILKTDRDSLLAFLRTVIAGSLGQSSNFFVVMGHEVIHLESTLNKLDDPRWSVFYEDASSPRKFAMRIGVVQAGNEPYWLARIEPAFDGARQNVSHTKGIIFYFQQFPTKGPRARHYKNLLLDIRD